MLDAVAETMRTPYGRLMVFGPPGMAKTTYAVVVPSAWYLGRSPNRKVIAASYSTDLIKVSGRKTRQLCRSPMYRAIFDTTVSSATSAADEWALTNGAEWFGGGLLSGLTGHRAWGWIVDDPVKGRQEADSPVTRKTIRAAYEDDLMSRVVPGAWGIMMQTRWHEDDLAGSILPKDYKGESGLIQCRDGQTWRVLNFQAQAERADDPLGRSPGEFLWPEWFTERHWAPFKQNSRTWNSLFQQRPKPVEGGIYMPHWFLRFDLLPAEADMCVHSWDTAYKPGTLNDPTAGGCFRFGRGVGGYYLTDVFRQRIDYPTLKRTVMNWALRDNPDAILIEDKASGQSLIQELKQETSLPIIAIEPLGDKLTRASAVSMKVESGQLYLPNHAGWLSEFEGEVFSYPEGVTHDDQVDMLSQFLGWVDKFTMRLEGHSAGPRESEKIDALRRNLNIQRTRGYGSVTGRTNTRGF